MQKITPCLWFDTQAEEAARFYASLFEGSKVGQIARYDQAAAEASGRPEGSAMTVSFRLAGQDFVALNGGPHFRFTPAISFFVTLETEAEVRALWGALVEGGSVLMPLQRYDWSECYGWLSDRYGVSWQVSLGRLEDAGQRIAPFMLFVGPQQGKAEEAIRYYTDVFKGSSLSIMHHPAGGTEPAGTVLHAQFTLEGQRFMAMDSALEHPFTFNEAVSFIIDCASQQEVDHYWKALSAHPEAERCGWLKDSFGVSWQVVPTALTRLLSDPARAGRVAQAMMGMKKLDIAALEAA